MNTVKKTIKTALLFLLVMVCATGVQAQGRKIIYLQNYDKAPYHFGFLLGANFMDYNLIMKEDYQSTKYYSSQELPNTGDEDLLVPVHFSADNFESYQIVNIERDTMNRLMKTMPRVGF